MKTWEKYVSADQEFRADSQDLQNDIRDRDVDDKIICAIESRMKIERERVEALFRQAQTATKIASISIEVHENCIQDFESTTRKWQDISNNIIVLQRLP